MSPQKPSADIVPRPQNGGLDLGLHISNLRLSELGGIREAPMRHVEVNKVVVTKGSKMESSEGGVTIIWIELSFAYSSPALLT